MNLIYNTKKLLIEMSANGDKRHRQLPDNWRVRDAASSGHNYHQNNLKPNEKNIRGRYVGSKVQNIHGNRNFVTVSYLKDLLEKDETEVLFTITGPRVDYFKQMLSREIIDAELMSHTLILLGKAIKADQEQNVLNLVSKIASNQSFILHIQQHMMNLQKQKVISQKEISDLHRLSIQRLVEFLLKYQQFQPSSSCDIILIILPLIIDTCDKFPINKENYPEIRATLQDLENSNDTFMKQFTSKEQKLMSKSEGQQIEQPPNNFRSISVFPVSEEIITGIPFIRPNIVQGKYLNTEHYLDVQFRLLREDLMRPLREAINHFRDLPINEIQSRSFLRYENVWYYKNFRVLLPNVVNGVVVYNASFTVDPYMKKHDWENSKRLMDGSLICFSSDNFKTMHFATIVGKVSISSESVGELAIKLESGQKCDLSIYTSCVMIENEAYFEAYRHTLVALQDINEINLPLKDYIVDARKVVKNPAYLNDSTIYRLKNHYSFPVLNQELWPSANDLGLNESQCAALKSGIMKEFSIIQGPPGTGKTYVGLKITEILLQNRPVYHSRRPIVIICYTNHALDQFLEGILEYTQEIVRLGGRSTNEVLKDYQLSHLRDISRREAFFKTKDKYGLEEYELEDEYQKNRRYLYELLRALRFRVNSIMEQIRRFTSDIKNSCTMVMKDSVLSEIIKFKHFRSLLQDLDDEKFPLSRYDGSLLSDWLSLNEITLIDNLLLTTEAMSFEAVTAVENIWLLPLEERLSLYKYWQQVYVHSKRRGLAMMERELGNVYKEQQEVRNRIDLEIIISKSIVGLTSTGAAKYRTLLKELDAEIVIFEEAAEVLESHIVTSLTRNVKHVIMIGDHQQLKPNPTVYELSKKYQFDVSLFERMVKNGVECQSLSIQHRMRPEIAALLVPHIYSNLQNHPSVEEYENVRGINSNIFFINHSIHEDENQSLKSHVNIHEARFIVELCRYLIFLNYKQSQITVLTTYTGQKSLMKKFMSEIIFSGVRIDVVDNFQGEENDIILISFVRSNDEGKIGFLNITNRVCVALSRAKKGLYCIGNFETMFEKSSMWKKVLNVLKIQNNIGEKLRLCCDNHPEVFLDVSTAEDFENAPDGVCSLMCNQVLKCGHKCPKRCHMIDRDHMDPCKVTVIRELPICSHEVEMLCSEDLSKKVCPYLCLQDLPCGHQCNLHCSEPCPEKCKIMVSVQATCKHIFSVSCFISMNPIEVHKQCKVACEKIYNCGHKCPLPCGKPCSKQCEIEKEVLSSCGHNVSIKCFMSNNPTAILKQCKVLCEKTLRCGHKCSLRCGDPCIECKNIVSVFASCGHEVHVQCYLSWNSTDVKQHCTSKCEKVLPCGHRCPHICKDRCIEKCELIVPVSPSCGHDLIVPCYLSSSFLKGNSQCKMPCEKILECGHRCQLHCGQNCSCEQIVSVLSECGHNVFIKCALKSESIAIQESCRRACEKLLKCEHQCRLRCGQMCEGKCPEKTTIQLECGHEKVITCFESLNLTDKIKICEKPCEKLLECGHKCLSSCGQPCNKQCSEKISIQLDCSHTKEITCFENLNRDENFKICKKTCEKDLECGHKCTFRCGEPCVRHDLPKDETLRFLVWARRSYCTNPCKKILKCGHECDAHCGQPCTKRCCQMVTTFSDCGHKVNVSCFMSSDAEAISNHCIVYCEKMLVCGHAWSGFCGHAINYKCKENCEIILPCGHKCDTMCNNTCTKHCLANIIVKKPCGHWQQSICFERYDKKCNVCKDSLFFNHLSTLSISSTSSSSDAFSD